MQDGEIECPECPWTGEADDVADDGPNHEFCCPRCGADIPND